MQPPSRRPSAPRALALIVAGAVLSGCGYGAGFSGSGSGFGGFGGARPAVPADQAEGYTLRRLRGQDDQVGGLQPDPTIRWPDERDEQRPSVFETEEERRAREARPPQRGSSSESPDIQRNPREALLSPTPPRPLAAPPEPELRGQAIPGVPAGTVTTGGSASGRTGTFGGPAGTGTTVRDGGTTTLMGADGTIRTVPTPR